MRDSDPPPIKYEQYVTKAGKQGRCNLCGSFGPLTEDHVPPKCCVPAKPARYAGVLQRDQRNKRLFKGTPVQNGFSYRTLCSTCNNTVLGGNNDNALGEMAQQVRHLIEMPFYIPAASTIRIKPQRVARSVLGHLMAIGIDRYDCGPVGEAIRNFVLGKQASPPPKMRLSYWVYKGNERVLIRDAGLGLLGTGRSIFFWELKFFPLAFVMTWDDDIGFKRELGIRNFDAYRDLTEDEEADVQIDLHPIPHPFLPELPTGHIAVMYGQDAIVVLDSRPIGTEIKLRG